MWEELKYYRQALGINMLWNAYPIVFIVRDGFGIGPQGSTFTILYWAVGLALLMPLNIFRTVFLPNQTLFVCWFSFLVLGWVYWKYYPSPAGSPERLRETLTYIIPVVFLFASMYYPNDKANIVLKVMVFYTLVASIGLLYSLTKDPHWTFGERAAIKFAANTQNSNPHAYANNALCSILSALLVAGRTKNWIFKIFYFLIAIFSVGVLILARTNMSLIGLGVMILIYVTLHGRGMVVSIFKPRVLAIAAVVYGIVAFLLSQFQFASYALGVYFNTFMSRFGSVIYTVTGVEVDQKTASIDHSSVNRVYSFKYVFEVFLGEGSLGTILFGEGYKAQFFDVPAIEALVNQGILGFILFNSFFVVMGFTALQQFFRPANDLSLFLAYFSIIVLIALFSGARPQDLSMWLVYVMFIRFFGVYSTQKAQSTLQPQPA
ncbi:hypothetical protein [Runella salmonicolor]|uniref:O-antigen ligase domain-containing protein n=1 Tax=Runella salmonicolor TaxID=2950278 RepID=A0ABT1FQK6_9BACT|nr:hypothetical protein [Runella salmonicolor]MCP1383780.1 hypothetical protein [Runella salmonicolor]